MIATSGQDKTDFRDKKEKDGVTGNQWKNRSQNQTVRRKQQKYFQCHSDILVKDVTSKVI